VLSRAEVRRLLAAIDNLKHKALVMLIYSGGLRVGEAVRLRLKDLDVDQKMVRVRARGTRIATHYWPIARSSGWQNTAVSTNPLDGSSLARGPIGISARASCRSWCKARPTARASASG
jgi:integrase